MQIRAILALGFLVAVSGQSWSQTVVPLGAYDVNRDGSIGDSDVWAIIDFVYEGGTSPVHPGSSRQTYNVTGALADYYGTTPDSYVTVIDALRVINFMNGMKIHQNFKQAEDVNDNGYCSAIDALLIINYLNRNDPAEPRISNVAYQVVFLPNYSYPLTLGFAIDKAGSVYYDVDGDSEVTSADALAVINWLNAHP